MRGLELKAIALGAMVALAAVPAWAQQRFDGVTLRVATYGGGWDKVVQQGASAQFQALGGRVEYVIGTPGNHLAKLIAAHGGPPPFDVFDVADSSLSDTVEGGFLQKLDLADIPNVKDTMQSAYPNLAITAWTTQEGIVYDADRFKVLGIPAPQHYRDLLNPKLRGLVEPIDCGTPGAVQFIVAAAKDDGGSETDLDAGFKLLHDLKALKYERVGSEAMQNLKTGDIYAVTMHAGYAIQGLRDNMPLGFTHPVVGSQKGIIKEGLLGIANGTPNLKAAEFFINAYLSEGAQYQLAVQRGIVPVNANARRRLGEDPLLQRTFLLKQEDVANMMRVDWHKLDIATFCDKWNRAIAR